MAIAFNQIPADLRVPLFYAELTSGGTPYDSTERLLLIGQKTAAGSAALDEPVIVPSGDEDALFGAGSILARMVKAAKANAPFQEIWAIAATDAGGATAATGSVDFTAITFPLTSTQVLTVYVAGEEYNLVASTASTATTVGDDLAAKINSDPAMPVSAVNAAGVVTLTAKNVGSLGNQIDLSKNLVGDESALTASVVLTAMAGGAGDPDITTALANCGDEDFKWLAVPYSDGVTTAALSAYFNEASGRWSPLSATYGHAFVIAQDTLANLVTLGNSLNDAHISVIGVKASPSPLADLLAAVAAKAALHLSDAPSVSRPMQFITLEGVRAPKIAGRLSVSDRNVLLNDGIATVSYTRAGEVQIERLRTTYKRNAAGANDTTFADVQALAQSQYVLSFLRSAILNRHAREALADDDTPKIGGVTRPRDIRNTIVAAYENLVDLGVVENTNAFSQALTVERNALDANRIDVFMPFDMINQLRLTCLAAVANLEM